MQIIGNTGNQRGFRADHHKADRVLGAKGDDRVVVGDIDVDTFRLSGNAGIAGRAIELVENRGGGDLPSQRMLASAGADQKHIHGCHPPCPHSARCWTDIARSTPIHGVGGSMRSRRVKRGRDEEAALSRHPSDSGL